MKTLSILALLCIPALGQTPFAQPYQIVQNNPAGRCSHAALPQYNAATGVWWGCVGATLGNWTTGVWVITGPPGTGGSTIPLTTSALRGTGTGNGAAVTGTGSDCVHVDGTSASCSGTAGASTALDNLASVNINTSLLAQTGVDAGSTAAPFRNLFLWGSGTFGTTYLEMTGTPTGARVWTLQDT